MFEKFTSQNQGDFRQRYQGTFGFFRNENKPPMLCRLTVVDGAVTFVDRRGVEYTLNPDSEKEIGFQFLPPKSGFFNTDEGAVYVQRNAARQFQRGISDRNTHMYLVTRERFQQLPVHFKYLEKVFDSKITTKDAMHSFLAGVAPSVALSQQFSLDAANRVWVFGSHCGSFINEDGKLKIKLNDPSLFRTEINDALRGIVPVEFVQ